MAAGDFHNFDNQNNAKSAEWHPWPVSVQQSVANLFVAIVHSVILAKKNPPDGSRRSCQKPDHEFPHFCEKETKLGDDQAQARLREKNS